MQNALIPSLLIFLSISSVFADSMPIPESADVPVWVDGMIEFLLNIPNVGPVVYKILSYVGVISGVMTGVASLFWFSCKALEKAALLGGLMPMANKVKKLYDTIYPYLAFLSIYNGPKLRKR